MTVSRLPSGKWRVQIRRKTLQLDEIFETEEAAKAAEADALERHEQAGQGLRLKDLWERYTQSRMFEEKSENTQKTERCHIKPVLESLGNYTMPELAEAPETIDDYLDTRRRVVSPRTGRKLSNTTLRLEVAALSAVVAFAKQRRIVRANFVVGISRPAATRRKRRFSDTEQGKLALLARHSDISLAKPSRFLLLVRHLGCRPGELAALLVSDIRLDRRELTFRDTKNGTDRNVHIVSEAATLINLQLADNPEESPYLFGVWSREKKEYVPYWYINGINHLKEEGHLPPDMHAHAGRREFISRAIEASVPLMTIKKQTGHKSTQAVDIYDDGLSTAREVRETWDKLDKTVQAENLLGAMRAAGMTPEQEAEFLQRIGQGQWIDPFKGSPQLGHKG